MVEFFRQVLHVLTTHHFVVINRIVLSFGTWILLPIPSDFWIEFTVFTELVFKVESPLCLKVILLAINVLHRLGENTLKVFFTKLVFATCLDYFGDQVFKIVLQSS